MSEENGKYVMNEVGCISGSILHKPKQIGWIILCGTLRLAVYDNQDFIIPTEEQIKNLHDMLCIDVILFNEKED